MTQPRGSLKIVPLWPTCADCGRRASIELPLVELPDGTSLCAQCERRRAMVASQRRVRQPSSPVSRPLAPRGTHYALLGLPMDATNEEIAAAVRAKMQYYTERQAGDGREHAQEMLDHLRKAARALRPDRRAAYDDEMRKKQAGERAALAGSTIRPIEEFPGRQVSSLKDFVNACEASANGWQIGERFLINRGLLFWVRFALGDEDIVASVEQSLGASNLSDMRKLNSLLYHLDPERPFRFFASPGNFDPIDPARTVTSIEELIAFTDKNWRPTCEHLYRGELITWLGNLTNGGRYQGTRYKDVATFFTRVCTPFGGSSREGVGLEALLEFLDPALPAPRIEVSFDNQPGAYDLIDWDEELPHKPVVMTVTNATRGYYAGTISLPAPPVGAPPFRWLDLDRLPIDAPGTTPIAAPPLSRELLLDGKQSQRYTLYLGRFKGLKRGHDYSTKVALARYAASPATTTSVAAFPVHMRLMRFREGYRGKLWANGLRGSLPGLLLNGGIGVLALLLIMGVGHLFAPGDSWGFFTPSQDFGSHSQWPALLDVFLTGLLRTFFMATALFGSTLLVVAGVAWGALGWFTGWRKGHTAFTARHDRAVHQRFARYLLWGTWVVGGLMLALGARVHPVLAHLGAGGFPHPTTLALTTGMLATPVFHSGDPVLDDAFLVLAVLAPGLSLYLVTHAITITRQRLYSWVAARWAGLLEPAGKE